MLQETRAAPAGARRRRAGRGVQRGASLPRRRAAARSSSIEPQAIVLEPVGRNTAPAIALAALAAPNGRAASADPVLLVLPADHVDPRRRRRSRAPCDGAARGRAGQAGHLRRRAALRRKPATATSSRARGATAGAYRDRAVRREAGPASARSSSSRRASITGTAACSCSARAAISRSSSASRRQICAGLRAGASPPRKRGSGFHAHRRQGVRGLPERFDRLRGDGEDRTMRGRAARCGLERRRLVVGAARGERSPMPSGNVARGDVLVEDTQRLLSATPRAAWSRRSGSRITWSSRPRTPCWSRRRSACRT